jgi:hypothetical protein
MSCVKRVGSLCPLCQQVIELGDVSAPMVEIEARYAAHLALHSTAEWARCVTDLRAGTDQLDQLRRIPYWAMPHA